MPVLPILGLQAFALPHPHRIDNATVSPRQYVYYHLERRKKHLLGFSRLSTVSTNAYQVDIFVVHSSVAGWEVAKFVVHNDKRSKTSFSIHKTARLPIGLTCDVAKVG